MENLFERKLKGWNITGSVYESTHIKLDPWPLPEDVKRPAQPRLQAVTVSYSNGSHAPVTIGVSTAWDATYGQLANAIRAQCKIPKGQHVELVLLRDNAFSG